LEGNLRVQLKVSLFDLRYKKFYGRTWSGPIVQLAHKKGKIRLDYKERLFFQTHIKDSDIVFVVELVCLKDDVKSISLGWTLFRPFKLDDSKNALKKDPSLRFVTSLRSEKVT
jgi:hypothetical protein